MKIHCCMFDAVCRRYDSPWRIYINTKYGQLIIALRWSSRTQAWLPWKTYNKWSKEKSHYSNYWLPIVWHPKPREKLLDTCDRGSNTPA